MRRTLLGIVVAALALGPGPAPAGNYATETLDRYFRIEWEAVRGRKGPAIAGYVHNNADYVANRVRLTIERLDTAGGVVGHTDTWVLGDVPQGGRAYFEASVPGASSYRVQVSSFEWKDRCGR